MKLTRKDVLIKSIRRPLGKLRWQDLRGPMMEFNRADVVMVVEAGRVKIMKDRQGQYLNIKREADGCVPESALNAGTQRPGTRDATIANPDALPGSLK